MRDLDRERSKLEAQEKKVIADIKKMAKLGQMDAVKIMAKDLVRTRRYVKKFILMRANIQAVALKVQVTFSSAKTKMTKAVIQTLRSNNAMAQAMKGVAKAMATMNKQLKLPEIQKIMMEFEKQSEIMDMKEEMMNDAVDDVIGDEEDDEESDKLVAQVFDELGLQLTEEVISTLSCQISQQLVLVLSIKKLLVLLKYLQWLMPMLTYRLGIHCVVYYTLSVYSQV
ncbi:hypothetical protein QZH41_015272 [Actinostola sp. cb2023]|nr:hypothetical protein QZH41_015272 [Actinostola sp. cb2023]